MQNRAADGLRRALGPLPQWPPCEFSECPQRESLVLAALDGFAAHVALLDERGVIRAVNQHWRQFAIAAAGTEAASCVGVNYLEACRASAAAGAPGAAAAFDAVAQVLTDGSEALEFPYRCDSSVGARWFRARLVPFDAGDRRGVLITHEDITVPKADRETLSLLARHAIEGIMIIDAAGRIEWLDDALLRMTGLRREASIGRLLTDVLAHQAIAAALLESIHAGIVVPREQAATVPVLRDDGQVLMVEVHVEPVVGGDQPARFVATLTDVTERRHLEHAVATVADEERQSLAHEVADGLGLELTAARLLVSMAVGRCEADGMDTELLLRVESAIERAAALARSITHAIVPLQAGTPLLPALEALAEAMGIPGVVSVGVVCGVQRIPVGNRADQFYRICQEAVANATRHAHAQRVAISLEACGQGLELRIVDDGRGFEVGEGLVGKGLRMMRLRAASLGGQLSIHSALGGGTTVSCIVGG
ncbi:MAG: PAS domain S-box protein [Pseudomonadota bacterium]